MRKPYFHLRVSPILRGIELFMSQTLENGDHLVANPITVTVVKDEDTVRPVEAMALFESKEALQPLLDELWRIGLRPSDIGTAGHLAATTHHLNDMRKLVEKMIDVKLST